MKNISEEIYRFYKKIDGYKFLFGIYGVPIKITLIIILIILSLFLMYSVYQGIYWVIGAFAFIVPFMIFMKKFLYKIFDNVASKHPKILNELKEYDLEFRIGNLEKYILREHIKERGFYTEKGLRYLVEIYEPKRKKSEIREIAIWAVIFSAIVSNAINLIFFGTGETYSRFIFIYDLISNKISDIMGYLIVIIFIKKYIDFIMLGWKDLKSLFFKGDYSNLIEIIQISFIADVINQIEEVSEVRLSESVMIEDIDNIKPIKKFKELNYARKETLKRLSELSKLKKQKAITDREYKELKINIMKSQRES